MNQKRELNEQDWRRIRNALDLYLRCQLGQLDEAFRIFMWEFEQRTKDDPDIPDPYKKERIDRVRWVLEKAEKEIAETAFGSPSTSFGIKNLEDPIRQLIIQANLRCCNFSDDLSKCPNYPIDCAAPTTGWCPAKNEGRKGLSQEEK
jgi:hypothetical protein